MRRTGNLDKQYFIPGEIECRYALPATRFLDLAFVSEVDIAQSLLLTREGLLGVASTSCLAVYTLGLEDNLPVWTKKWVIPCGPS